MGPGRETRTVKDLLADMKDTSELMVDLAYSAVIYGDADVAEEVINLEHYMNYLESHTQLALIQSTRNRDEAEQLLGILRIVRAAEMIADAADDIATVVTHDLGIPDQVRVGLMASREATISLEATADAALTGKTVGAVEDRAAGAQVIAIRRADDWLIAPDDTETIAAGDRVMVRGPHDGLRDAAALTDGTASLPEQADSSPEELDDLVDTLVEMKNIMDTAVGLGYSAALFNSEDLAEEVLSLETETDTMMEDLEVMLLRRAGEVDDPGQLRGLLTLAVASEVVTDAAMEIAGAVLHDIEAHPVLTEAIEESEEQFTIVTADDALTGDRIADAIQDTGATVLALNRGSQWWYTPDPDTVIEAGDRLICKVPADAADALTPLQGA